MKEATIDSLSLYQQLLNQLSPLQFSQPLPILGHATIGQQLRHVLEFYDCVLFAHPIICYDNRPRNQKLEENPTAAQQKIKELLNQLELSDLNQSIPLSYCLGTEVQMLSTTIERELLYCLDHSIHHAAIIRIGLQQCFDDVVIPPNFGFAYSTLAHKTAKP